MSAQTPLIEVVAGLYEIGVAPSPGGSPGGRAIHAYFLTRDDVSPAVPPTLGDAWSSLDWIGWFVFLARPVEDGAAFVTAGRAALPSLDSTSQSNLRALIWLDAPDALGGAISLLFYQLNVQPDIRTVADPQTYVFDWSPLTLTIQPGVRVSIDFDAPAFLVTTVPSDTGLISLNYGGQPAFYDTSKLTWKFSVPLLGQGAGAFQMALGLDLSLLMGSLGCTLRYFAGQMGGATDLRYPFLAPIAPGASIAGFALSLHPLFPTDPAWTSVGLDLGGASPNQYQAQSRALRPAMFRTASGGTIALAPVQGAAQPPGFAFCSAPSPAGSPAAETLYLAPSGSWRVDSIESPAGSPAAPGALYRWMCGLTGEEFLEVAEGDRLAFETPSPAYSPVRGAGSSGPPLVDTYSTAWLRFPAPGTPGQRRYFGQPSASVYFASAAPGEFASPVASMLSDLSSPITMPLVPYGGLFGAGGASDAAAFNDFESNVLTMTRHACATAQSGGPVFLSQSELELSHSWRPDSEPLSGSAVTPQGFVVRLNQGGEGGTWNGIELAASPDDPSELLGFSGGGSPGQVSPALATTLLQNELFLVVSDAASLGAFADRLSIGGFRFVLDVPLAPQKADGTLLVFKYNTALSLAEMAGKPELWAGKESFVPDLQSAQRQLLESIAQASGTPRLDSVSERFAATSPAKDDPLANFRAIANDPSWTGVLALNCAVDGNGMSPDLQMLLGGINGQLRAHHMGFERNRLTQVAGGEAAIQESSVFGAIVYPSSTQPLASPDTADDFAYEVENLTVVFSNSKIQTFNVVAGLTINRLFGRAVTLAAGSPGAYSNTLSIPGRYQVQDGVGTVTFRTSQPYLYRFPIPLQTSRVLDRILFDRATLVPVSRAGGGSPGSSPVVASPADGLVRSRFTLGGALWFNPEPFAMAKGLDLFSFGEADSPAGGLSLDGLTVDIAFALDAEGALEPGSKRVTGDVSRLVPTATPGAIRPGSLLHSLPLQVSRFLAQESGFTASSLGASPVHVLQLEGATHPGGSPQPGGSPSIRPAAPPPNVTTMPQYGLELDMPLGSLGALSSVHVGLMAKLILGWGASRVVPETDAACVLVQLPQVFAGYGGFELQGILKTTFGDANLLRVDLPAGPVYAVLFNNIQLSVLGYGFPPGVVIDFLIFAGAAGSGASTNDTNLAWFLGASQPTPASPSTGASA